MKNIVKIVFLLFCAFVVSGCAGEYVSGFEAGFILGEYEVRDAQQGNLLLLQALVEAYFFRFRD